MEPCPECGGTGYVNGNRCSASFPHDPVQDALWSTCPYGLLRSRPWQLVQDLDDLGALHPISPWPGSWARATVLGVQALNRARAERRQAIAEANKARR